MKANEFKQGRALITGITGQDGSYLAELLLSKGYEVHGIVRRVALQDAKLRMGRIGHLLKKITLHPASMESYASLYNVFKEVKPNEVYHLAAQSFVAESFVDPFSTTDINTMGTLRMLECNRDFGARFYFAGSSEQFGKVVESPQNEQTPFYPRSPYGISKVAGFDLVRNYRESYDMFACSGILFNHESPRRGMEFVTRKITYGAARIYRDLQETLHLGNLDARRDWGYAYDYVKAMWLMLQQDEPDDYVIATGEVHSVREFVKAAFDWHGLCWSDYVTINRKYKRPAEVELLVGDASKACKKLGWKPEFTFEMLVNEMSRLDALLVDAECGRRNQYEG